MGYTFKYVVPVSLFLCYCDSLLLYSYFFFFKQKTAYEMRISDWSSDVCSSDLIIGGFRCGGRIRRDRQSQGKREKAGRNAPADRRIFCGHDNFLLQENCHIRWSGLRHSGGEYPRREWLNQFG